MAAGWERLHAAPRPGQRITLVEAVLSFHSDLLSWTGSSSDLRKRLLISLLPLIALGAAAGALGPSWVASAHPGASPAPAVRVAQQTYRIVYGKEIAVTVQAQSDAGEIVGVLARYRPRGPDRISVYDYPAFTPGRSITASFSIKTGGGSYFPPGTDFDIYFELTDSAGNVTKTETQTVEYLDPAFKWKRLSRGTLTAVFYNVPDDRVARLLDDAAAELPDLARMTGAPAGQQYKAVLFRTVSDASSSFPRVSEAAADRQFFAGFAQPEYGLFVLGSPEEGSFRHEMTHLLVDAAVTSPLASQLPAWLNEGLAVWAQGDGLDSLDSQIRSAAKGGRLLRVRSMGTIPGTGQAIALFYPESGAFVGYLYTRFGPDGMAALLRAMNEGRRVNEAAQQAWGVSLDDIENEWRVSLGAAPLPTPSPTHVPAGTAATSAGTTPAALPTALPVGTPQPAAPSPVASVSPAPSGGGSGFPAWGLFLAAGAGLFAVAVVVWQARFARMRRGN